MASGYQVNLPALTSSGLKGLGPPGFLASGPKSPGPLLPLPRSPDHQPLLARPPPHLPVRLCFQRPCSLPSPGFQMLAPPSCSLPGHPASLRIPEHSPGTALQQWPRGGAGRETRVGVGGLERPVGARNQDCLWHNNTSSRTTSHPMSHLFREPQALPQIPPTNRPYTSGGSEVCLAPVCSSRGGRQRGRAGI